MLPEEWRACDDLPRMLRFIVHKHSLSRMEYTPRKQRLYACACCRAVLDAWWPRHCRDVVEIAERFADGLTPEKELNDARSLACQAAQRFNASKARWPDLLSLIIGRRLTFTGDVADSDIAFRMTIAFDKGIFQGDVSWSKAARPLFFDIFGHVFFPATFLPEWRTSTVADLARQMYDSYDFSAMPILADALQDAGCADETILTHCRGAGPHVKGCHVVDACLSKS